jgi:hypothetical protein
MRSTAKLALLAASPLLVSALFARPALADDANAPPVAAAASVTVVPASPNAPTTVVAPPGSTVVVAPASPASTDGTLLVHLDSPSPVSLEHRSAQSAWEHVCDSPCDQRLPVGDEYRIVGGADVNESNPFVLDSAKGDRAVLYVAPGSKSRQKIGTGILITGAVLFVGGIVGGLLASCPSCTFQANGTTDNQNFLAIGIGTGIAVVGLSGGIFGAAWMVDNAHSRVSGAVQAAPPARGANDPAYVTGLRAPMPGMTQALNVPLFSF